MGRTPRPPPRRRARRSSRGTSSGPCSSAASRRASSAHRSTSAATRSALGGTARAMRGETKKRARDDARPATPPTARPRPPSSAPPGRKIEHPREAQRRGTVGISVPATRVHLDDHAFRVVMTAACTDDHAFLVKEDDSSLLMQARSNACLVNAVDFATSNHESRCALNASIDRCRAVGIPSYFTDR